MVLTIVLYYLWFNFGEDIFPLCRQLENHDTKEMMIHGPPTFCFEVLKISIMGGYCLDKESTSQRPSE